MIFREKHRIISEIEKRRVKGHILHFLSGDAIKGNDTYFYSLRYGIQGLLKTLMLHYFKEKGEFDYLIYVNTHEEISNCYVFSETAEYGCTEITIKDLLDREDKRKRTHSLNVPRKNSEEGIETESAKSARTTAEEQTSNVSNIEAQLNRITKIIESGKKRILVLLENMEWIANLYESSAVKTTWISRLQNSVWQKSEKLMIVVTIKDMELLKKYNFSEDEIYICNPTAHEIMLAYYRYIVRNLNENYQWDFKILDDIAHSMSIGKKTLIQCMRIIHSVTKNNPSSLDANDFIHSAELNIEEKVLWEDVILSRSVKERIEEAVDRFLHNDEQGQARKGILLTGPPGTGKTMLAKALATEKKCYFMAPTLADLKAEYVGQTSAKVKRIFAEARGNQPTILFIDEADTVFPSRDLNSQDRDSFGLDMVNQFLQEMDGAKTGLQKIFTIAATNRPMAIDRAIRSRLSNDPILVPLPDYDSRRQLFNNKMAPFSLNGKSFADDILKKSDGMSGRDIDNVVKMIQEHFDVNQLGDNKETHDVFNEIFLKREKTFLKESIFSTGIVVSPEENKLKFDDVIGYASLKEEIIRQAKYIMAPPALKGKYKDYGIEPAKGILLYGPPGNAKTVLAEAAAGQFGFYFFKIISQDFISSYPEQQIKRLTDIFQDIDTFAKMIDAPGIVLFFDEFDSLAGKSVLNPSVRGTLLTFIADMRKNVNSKIMLIAATNFYSRIDEAVKRKGRLDSHLFMDNPTIENGKLLLKAFFSADKKIVGPVDDCVIDAIYDGLTKEVQNNPEKRHQIMEDIFGNNEMFDLLTSDKKEFVYKKLKELRPSGADLKIKYETLKEIAFVNGEIGSDNKIVIKYPET